MNGRLDCYLLLIGGPTCSGKTRLAGSIEGNLGGPAKCNVLHMDGWCRPNFPNFDIPEAIYQDDFKNDVLNLLSGESIESRNLGDHTNQVPTSTKVLTPKPLLIVEGVFALCFDEILAEANLKVYIDVPLETMCLRRIRRDVVEYGENVEEVLQRVENQVLPGTKDFVAPTKRIADLMLDETTPLASHLKQTLEMIEGLKT